MIRAAIVAGKNLLNRSGQSAATARVTAPRMSALGLKWLIKSGQARMAPTGPPVATSAPRNGSVWVRNMMIPTPDMNPEMTE